MMNFVKRLCDSLRPRRRATLSFRVAEVADVGPIVEAILAEAAEAHFNADYSLPMAAKGLRHQVSCLVAGLPVPWPGKRGGASGRAWLILVNGNDVGFVLLLEDLPGSLSERVEVFALVVARKARGRGIATEAVRQLIEGVESRQIYARCYPASTSMRHVFERAGFVATSTSRTGIVTLEFDRPMSSA
jgi:GNAT superfamily N-acetyltransferase